MTLFIGDIVADKLRSKAVVEIDTDELNPAPLQGTVKIHMQYNYTFDECFAFLHDVLYVPGLC